MIRRIELRNFMSHEHTVIEPAEGLTALVGPNNIGKSAIVSAIQILCHNDNSTYVTRHGEKECSIEIETDDGHTVKWRRRGSSVSYVIDGEEFDRLGGSVPDTIFDALRLPRVSNESGESFDVHVGEQKSPIFLLDKPASRAAQFFASSSDASKLVEMQSRHKEKIRDARKRKTVLEAENEGIAEALEALKPVGDIEKKVGALEKKYEEITGLEKSIDRLEDDYGRIDELIQVLARHSAECEATQELKSPPKLSDTSGMESLIAGILSISLAIGDGI